MVFFVSAVDRYYSFAPQRTPVKGYTMNHPVGPDRKTPSCRSTPAEAHSKAEKMNVPEVVSTNTSPAIVWSASERAVLVDLRRATSKPQDDITVRTLETSKTDKSRQEGTTKKGGMDVQTPKGKRDSVTNNHVIRSTMAGFLSSFRRKAHRREIS
uniref:Uncharacterized protein n=1 Tax=Grammatophora oceanica TaxID=210454 RepID=A0A7S1V5Q5_9STRA